MPAKRVARIVVAAATTMLANPLAAQVQQPLYSPTAIGLQVEAPHLRFSVPAPPTAAMPHLVEPDSLLPCPQCYPKKHFWVAAAYILALQLIPNAVSRLGGNEWADVSLQSWGNNLTLPWQWDNNAFKNNQFSHPYHGAMYFNAGRTNGYNFWQSAPWAFAGSLTWELFGEVWAPAPNDLLNTTLGGITLGEMLFRVSSLTLKNESRGFERVVREVTAGILNPVRGFNRVVRGEAWQHSRTPPEWRPSTVFAAVDVGYRRLVVPGEAQNEVLNGAVVIAELAYGDPILDLAKKPFSTFGVRLAYATNNGSAGGLSELTVRGSLGAKKLGSGQLNHLAVLMTYDYIANPIIEFGGQGFYGGAVLGRRPAKGPRMRAELLGQFMPVAAIQSDFYLTQEGRDYDYGIGLGGAVNGAIIWPGLAQISAYSRYVFLPIISGFPGDHQLLFTGLTGKIYWRGRLGLGADYYWLWRWSNYYGRSNVSRENTALRVYLTTAIPQWRD